MTTRSILLTILNVLSAFVGIVVGLHIIFLLLGANTATPIISWINNMSSVFLYPFQGLFQNISFGGNSLLDINALIALLVYAIAFSLLTRLINLVTADHEVHGEIHSHV